MLQNHEGAALIKDAKAAGLRVVEVEGRYVDIYRSKNNWLRLWPDGSIIRGDVPLDIAKNMLHRDARHELGLKPKSTVKKEKS